MIILNKKTKIKIFQGYFYEIEEQVNDFTKEHDYEIIDIKFNDTFTKACVIYTLSKINEDKNDKKN